MYVLLGLFVLVQGTGTASTPGVALDCTETEHLLLERAEEALGRGDQQYAFEILGGAAGPHERACALLRAAHLALRGWDEARRIARKGGAPELLDPVRRALSDLERLEAALAVAEARPPGTTSSGTPQRRASSDIALTIEYAQTAIRAAVSAAQDERPEMELLLVHARDLTERLGARGVRPVWPRSYNLLAGELWFEVDRYEEARSAYERAVRADASASALVGLARALARLGRFDEACDIARQAKDASDALRADAARDLARCR